MAADSSGKKTVQKRSSFVLNAHFAWFVGHLLTFTCTFAHLVVSTFKPLSQASTKWFTYTIYSIILSYSIVLFKTYSVNKIIKILFTNSLMFLKSSNSLYLLMSVLFLANHDIVKHIQGALYPFAIYSFFHSLNYMNQNLLPRSFTRANSRIKALVSSLPQKYYEPSLYIAANLELTVMFQLIFANFKNLIFFFKTSPMLVMRTFSLTLIYIAFIKLRYDDSIHMRTVLNNYDLKINQFLYANQRIPKPVIGAWFRIRNIITAYVSPIKIMDTSQH